MTKQAEQTSIHEGPAGVLQIDTHIHLWNLSVYKRRDWLQDKQQLIRDFTPVHAAQEFATCGIAYGIVIGAAKYSVTDNLEWLRVAQSSPILLGAVPGCYLDDPGLSNLLDQYSKWESFLAVRASPTQHSEKWHDLSPIEGGLCTLSDRGVPLEILTDADGLFGVAPIAEQFPDLTVIINHCGLPGPNSVDKRLEPMDLALHPPVRLPVGGGRPSQSGDRAPSHPGTGNRFSRNLCVLPGDGHAHRARD